MTARFRARARALGPAFDLLAAYGGLHGFYFERAGTGVATAGVAHRIVSDGGPGRIDRLSAEAGVAFAGIRASEKVPPIAVGCIPFDDGWPADLVVPARAAVRRAPGKTSQLDVWAEGLAPADRERDRWTGRAVPHDPFEEIQLLPEPSPEAYQEAVAEAVESIRAGELRKVVLARSIVVEAGRELDAKQLLWRLRAVDPDCYVFAAPQLALGRDEVRSTGVLVGATPELLARKEGDRIAVDPLAGSAPRSGDPDEDRAAGERLLASAKDRDEHEAVVEFVEEALRELCDEVERSPEPALAKTANVWHLSTPFAGRLREGVSSVLEVVAALHPTPAVCGTPRDVALDLIAELEPFDRECYAGPVGWVDANGDGEWAIALRCAELSGERARLYAGAGIVAASGSESELDETERKFRAFLDSLRWG